MSGDICINYLEAHLQTNPTTKLFRDPHFKVFILIVGEVDPVLSLDADSRLNSDGGQKVDVA